MALSATDLAFGYPGRTVGAGVTLTVAPGEAVALLGPNGGGKTTLLKTLLGLLQPHGGAVHVDGDALSALPAGERARRLGYVPQAHAGAFAFAASDVVLMGRTAHQGLFARPSAVDRRIAAQMMETLGIGHLAARPYTLLSGGERQLVLIARALAQEPRYVVLDEPTASLDFGNQGKVLRQIAALTARGLGVLFTTHDPNQALRHADRVALLGDETLLALGDPREVLTVERLERLYDTRISALGADGALAYLPG
jgi:iron complex transport system ATP-binding protein